MHASARTMVIINKGLINSHYSLSGNTIDVYIYGLYIYVYIHGLSMISSVDLMTGCRPNFFNQIISAGRTNGHGGPHAARGPRVGRACAK